MRRCISCSTRKSSYPLNPLCNFKMFWSEPTVATPDDIAAICNLEREADKLGLLFFFQNHSMNHVQGCWASNLVTAKQKARFFQRFVSSFNQSRCIFKPRIQLWYPEMMSSWAKCEVAANVHPDLRLVNEKLKRYQAVEWWGAISWVDFMGQMHVYEIYI